MDAMNGISGITGFERRENRLFGWMVAFSMLVHVFALVIGSLTASLFPATPYFPIVTVELTEIPPSELLEESPPHDQKNLPLPPARLFHRFPSPLRQGLLPVGRRRGFPRSSAG